jgi:hypothetical protein
MDAMGALIEEGKLHEASPQLQKKLGLMPPNPVSLLPGPARQTGCCGG